MEIRGIDYCMKTKALIVVDVQNDFCPGGLYPVPEGDSVVEPINKLLAYARDHDWYIAFSRDWHPVDMTGSRHCIQGTTGAEYHPQLAITKDDRIISKGLDLTRKHYSAFNGDDVNLNDLLKKNGVREVYVAGLAFDYCVKDTAFDAKQYGYKTTIIRDATRGIFKKITTEELKKELAESDINLINANDITDLG